MDIEFKWGSTSGSTYSVDDNTYHRTWRGHWYKNLIETFDRSKQDLKELEQFHQNLTKKRFTNEIDKIFTTIKLYYDTPEFIEYIEEKMKGLKYE